MPYLPCHGFYIIITMTKTQNVFHSCYLNTRLSLRYQIFFFIRNWVVNTLQTSDLLNTHYTNGVISLRQSRASHTLWERAQMEKKLSLGYFLRFLMQTWQHHSRSTLSSLVKVPQVSTQSFYNLHLEIFKYLKQLYVLISITLPMCDMRVVPAQVQW